MTVLAPLRWWRRTGQAERLDLYTRLSLYGVLALEPLLGFGTVTPELSPIVGGLTMIFVLGHTLASGVLLNACLDHRLGRRPRPDRLIAVVGGLTLAATLLAVLLYPDAEPGRQDGPATVITVVIGSAFVIALSATVPVRLCLAAVAAGGLVMLLVFVLQGAPVPAAASTAGAFVGLLGFVVLTCRSSIWILDITWELDRSRQVQAQLAVAEERLRFARDLHDVVGRNLSVIALKSELAGQLVRRGRAGAAEEIGEVRQLAEDSLTELRAVVRGYRATDLATELAGARSVLAAAGVDCQVTGDDHELPADVQRTLGWVVREGTTNVLRHSEARVCMVTLSRPSTGSVTLSMDNDGVRSDPDSTGPQPAPTDAAASPKPTPAGSGLPGLAERVAVHGGTMTAERRSPDRFVLTVELPQAVVS